MYNKSLLFIIWTVCLSELNQVLISASGLTNSDYSVEVNYERRRNGVGELHFRISSSMEELEGYKIELRLADKDGSWKSASEFTFTDEESWNYLYENSFIQPGQVLDFTVSLFINNNWLKGNEHRARIPNNPGLLTLQGSAPIILNVPVSAQDLDTDVTTTTTTTNSPAKRRRNPFRSLNRPRPSPPPRPPHQGLELDEIPGSGWDPTDTDFLNCLEANNWQWNSDCQNQRSTTRSPQINPDPSPDPSPATTPSPEQFTPRRRTTKTPGGGGEDGQKRKPPPTTKEPVGTKKHVDLTVIIVSTVVPIIVMVGIILIVLIVIRHRSRRSPPTGYHPPGPPTFSNVNYHSRATLEAHNRQQLGTLRTDVTVPTQEEPYAYVGDVYEEIPAGEDDFAKPQPASDWDSENYEDPDANTANSPDPLTSEYIDPEVGLPTQPPSSRTMERPADPLASEYIDPEVGLTTQPPLSRTMERPAYERPLPQQPGGNQGRTYTILNRETSDAYDP